jgi:hypothetical protein
MVSISQFMKRSGVAAGAVIAAILLAMPAFASAAGNSITLGSPSSFASDGTFTVSVSTQSGTDITAAFQADITFDGNQLEAQSATYDTKFTKLPDSVTNTSHIFLSAFTLEELKGQNTVATLKFKALKSSGTASITVNSDKSKLYVRESPAVNTLASVTGATVNLAGAPVSSSSPVLLYVTLAALLAALLLLAYIKRNDRSGKGSKNRRSLSVRRRSAKKAAPARKSALRSVSLHRKSVSKKVSKPAKKASKPVRKSIRKPAKPAKRGRK